MPGISNDWLPVLKQEFGKPYYADLYAFIKQEYKERRIFPPADDIFNAFHYTPFSKVKAVILGQDPYHNEHEAHGLAFSVKPEILPKDIPPSLKNIYKELHDDLGCYIPDNGYLKKWADQGVLLLNTVLTVRAGAAASHRKHGWEQFTDAVIKALDPLDRPLVFLLWGRPAGEKEEMLHNKKHLVLKCAHPSPLSASRGFFGCRHFSKCNEFLKANGEEIIDWQIENIR